MPSELCQVNLVKSNCLVYLFIHFWDNKTLHPRNSSTEPANWYIKFHKCFTIATVYLLASPNYEWTKSLFSQMASLVIPTIGWFYRFDAGTIPFLPPAFVTPCKLKLYYTRLRHINCMELPKILCLRFLVILSCSLPTKSCCREM